MKKIHRRKIIVIFHGALICGLVGFLLTTNFLKDLRYFRDSDRAEEIEVDCDGIYPVSLSQIYIATVDIPAGSDISEEIFVQAAIPTDLFLNFYIQEEDILTQSRARLDIKRGMILTNDLIQ